MRLRIPNENVFLGECHRRDSWFGARGCESSQCKSEEDIFFSQKSVQTFALYSALSSLFSPTKLSDSSTLDIVQLVKDHFDPAPLEITESFCFGMWYQQPGDSINDYIVALKKLPIHCNFGKFLNHVFRDRFVCWPGQ